jgi:hypothetical protein
MSYVYLRNNRLEYNPISKLKMVRNNLKEALTMHYRSAPGWERIPVIPLLVHWGMEIKEALKALPGDFEVEIIGKSVAQDTERICEELIHKAKMFYEFVAEEPPVVSVNIKRTLLSCVDLSLRAYQASGRFAPVPPELPPREKNKPVIERSSGNRQNHYVIGKSEMVFPASSSIPAAFHRAPESADHQFEAALPASFFKWPAGSQRPFFPI